MLTSLPARHVGRSRYADALSGQSGSGSGAEQRNTLAALRGGGGFVAVDRLASV